MRARYSGVFFLVLMILLGGTGFSLNKNTVTEKWSSLSVRAESPIPKEIENESDARAVAREAAINWGQNQLLAYILKKKTHSGKLLAVAELPSLELQKEIRDYVKTTKVDGVEFGNKICRLTLILSKDPLKKILRNN